MPVFERYIGIHYSGAEVPTANLKQLRVYSADWVTPPREVATPVKSHKHWTRKGIAEWLVAQLSGPKPTLVGLDHAFSFPLRYFERHRLPPDWPKFLDDFQKHWPTDDDHTYVGFVREGVSGRGAKREGDPDWLRLTEYWTGTTKSVFHFNAHGQVATAAHAGLPWLRFLRKKCGDRVHFWPFDGWEIPAGRSALVEVNSSVWLKRIAEEGRDRDQQAACAIAAWLRRADTNDSLSHYLNPPLEHQEKSVAQVEGWILGAT